MEWIAKKFFEINVYGQSLEIIFGDQASLNLGNKYAYIFTFKRNIQSIYAHCFYH